MRQASCVKIKEKRPPKRKVPHGKIENGTPQHETHARVPTGGRQPWSMPMHARRESRRKHNKVLTRRRTRHRTNHRCKHHAASQPPTYAFYALYTLGRPH